MENSGIAGLYSGGISVTACLSDFSLHIFHPYGGSKKGGPTGMYRDPYRLSWVVKAEARSFIGVSSFGCVAVF